MLPLYLLGGVVVALIGATAFALIGFGIRWDAWALAGMGAGLVVWFFQRVFVAPDDQSEPAPMMPRRFGALDVDRRTRAWESQLRGSQGSRPMTVGALHTAITALADELADGRPLPPTVDAYVRSDPRPLSRARLRTIIRELNSL
ncbi:hypothetical protein GCM10025738_13790 [Microbacterium fluvii]